MHYNGSRFNAKYLKYLMLQLIVLSSDLIGAALFPCVTHSNASITERNARRLCLLRSKEPGHPSHQPLPWVLQKKYK